MVKFEGAVSYLRPKQRTDQAWRRPPRESSAKKIKRTPTHDIAAITTSLYLSYTPPQSWP